MKLLALIAIAGAPLLIARVAIDHAPSWIPGGSTNRGELITPPIAAGELAPGLAGPGGWVLIQPVARECDQACAQLLYLSRQVIIGLGRDASRVRRILIAPDGVAAGFSAFLAEEHGDVGILPVSLAPLSHLMGGEPLLFLMDPNANIMMFHTLDKAGKPMLKDLKHLLKLSNIG